MKRVWVLGSLLFLGLMAAAPATTGVSDGTRERAIYDSDWRMNIGEATGAKAEEFVHEVVAGGKAAGREEKIAHFRKALELRPGDPGNVVLEWKMAIMMLQSEPQMLEEGTVVLKHMVETYDHKVYYRMNNRSSGSDSPDMKMVHATIMLSELTRDDGEAQKYIDMAMDNLEWTFRKRTGDVEATPKPTETENGFSMRPVSLESRVAAWEKSMADAKAGKAVGPYEQVFAETAVRVLVGRRKDDVQEALQGVVDRYAPMAGEPESPVVTAARAEGEKRGMVLVAARVPASAMAPVGTIVATRVGDDFTAGPWWAVVLFFGALVSVIVVGRRKRVK